MASSTEVASLWHYAACLLHCKGISQNWYTRVVPFGPWQHPFAPLPHLWPVHLDGPGAAACRTPESRVSIVRCNPKGMRRSAGLQSMGNSRRRSKSIDSERQPAPWDYVRVACDSRKIPIGVGGQSK